jgi:biopolymer transport protein ExbB/TolQ
MDILNNLYLLNILHTITEFLIIPAVVILFGFILFSLYTLGTLIMEIVYERRHYRAAIPELIALLGKAAPGDLAEVVERSGLLRSQKDDLEELIAYMYLPESAHAEVAKRLLSNESLLYRKMVARTDAVARVAPMLGLMGTLIPLGPGIIALGEGDTAALASALLVAFDTTVAGLASAAVCYVVSLLRKRWYADYQVSMEAVFNTVLEKAVALHSDGYDFEESVYHYNPSGRRAMRMPLAASLPGGASTDGKDVANAASKARTELIATRGAQAGMGGAARRKQQDGEADAGGAARRKGQDGEADAGGAARRKADEAAESEA